MQGMQTTQLRQRMAEIFRHREVRPRTLPDELLAHSAILRELCNHGVHPREVRDDLERYSRRRRAACSSSQRITTWRDSQERLKWRLGENERRLVEIAHVLGVSKQRAHQLGRTKFPNASQ